ERLHTDVRARAQHAEAAAIAAASDVMRRARKEALHLLSGGAGPES
ncbi:MAG: hypothetical protein QOJ03_604, partial [Frankiaceae bacterium]|nr:hypothetical protein [Frankiaceae bacterium]